jgi:hypothetical protein
LIALAILGAVTACSSAPQDFTVHGTIEIAVQDYSEFQSTYLQAYQGNARVTITDPSGKVIAVTTADDGNVKQVPGYETLTWGWTVKVPEGLSFYGVSVSDASGSPVQFTEAQMKAGPGVCIGDAYSSG